MPAVAGLTSGYSGTKCWGTNLTGNYTLGDNITLTSPVFSLTAYTTYQLSFWHWYVIGAAHYGQLELSVDGGAFGTIYVPTYSTANGWAGTHTSWSRETVDLTAYVGHTVQYRFRFVSTTGTTYRGWYIDDVKLSGWSGADSTITQRYCISLPADSISPMPIVLGAGSPTCSLAVRTLGVSGSPYQRYLWSSGETTATIQVTTTRPLRVHCTVYAGSCNAITPDTVIWIQAPQPYAGRDTFVCAGDIVKLWVTSDTSVGLIWTGPSIVGSPYNDTIRVNSPGTYLCRAYNTLSCTSAVTMVHAFDAGCQGINAVGFGMGGASDWTVTIDSLSTPAVLPAAQRITVSNLSAGPIDFGLYLAPPPGRLRDDSIAGANRFNVQSQFDQSAFAPTLASFQYARDHVPPGPPYRFGDVSAFAGGAYNVPAPPSTNTRSLWLKLVPPTYFSANPYTLHLLLSGRAHVP